MALQAASAAGQELRAPARADVTQALGEADPGPRLDLGVADGPSGRGSPRGTRTRRRPPRSAGSRAPRGCPCVAIGGEPRTAVGRTAAASRRHARLRSRRSGASPPRRRRACRRRRPRPSPPSRRTGRTSAAGARTRGSRSPRRRRRRCSGRRERSIGSPWASAIRSTMPRLVQRQDRHVDARASRRPRAMHRVLPRDRRGSARRPRLAQHRQARGEAASRRRRASARAHRATSSHREALRPAGAKTRSVSSTYGRLSPSVTPTIGTCASDAARSRSSSGSPIQTSAAAPVELPPSRTADASPPSRSSRASSGTSARAPSTTSGRRSRAARARLADEREQRARAERRLPLTAPPPAADVDRLQDPHRGQVGDHRRAADRDERQRDAGDRRHADRHADVDEHLEHEREHEPAGDDRAEQVRGARDDLQPAPDDEQVEQQQDRGAEEAALLGERGEREVGRVLGQVVEARLRRAGDAAPAQAARADRGDRLVHVVGRPARVRVGMREAGQRARPGTA